MKLIRPPLPKTRSWKLTKQLRKYQRGCLIVFHPARVQFGVWAMHSRWAWWKFYRD